MTGAVGAPQARTARLAPVAATLMAVAGTLPCRPALAAGVTGRTRVRPRRREVDN